MVRLAHRTPIFPLRDAFIVSVSGLLGRIVDDLPGLPVGVAPFAAGSYRFVSNKIIVD